MPPEAPAAGGGAGAWARFAGSAGAAVLPYRWDKVAETGATYGGLSAPALNDNGVAAFMAKAPEALQRALVLALDEVDRLFNHNYASEIFGLFRSWHNLRALDPNGPWSRLTLAIAYATEAHLFISDLNQSPFNVGTRLTLEDFTVEELAELNERYGRLLAGDEQMARFRELVGGHPYLAQRGLYEIAKNKVSLAALERNADRDDGPFGDHLNRLLISLQQDQTLLQELRGFVLSGTKLSNTGFYRLRSAGVLTGETVDDPRLRCNLYVRYLKKHLE